MFITIYRLQAVIQPQLITPKIPKQTTPQINSKSSPRPKRRQPLMKSLWQKITANFSLNLTKFLVRLATTSNYSKTTRISLRTFGCSCWIISSSRTTLSSLSSSATTTAPTSEKSSNSMSFKRSQKRPKSGLTLLVPVRILRATLKRLEKSKRKPSLSPTLMSHSSARLTLMLISTSIRSSRSRQNASSNFNVKNSRRKQTHKPSHVPSTSKLTINSSRNHSSTLSVVTTITIVSSSNNIRKPRSLAAACADVSLEITSTVTMVPNSTAREKRVARMPMTYRLLKMKIRRWRAPTSKSTRRTSTT